MDARIRHDFDQIVEFAAQYSATGHMPSREPKLEVLDAQGETAVIKLTAVGTRSLGH